MTFRNSNLNPAFNVGPCYTAVHQDLWNLERSAEPWGAYAPSLAISGTLAGNRLVRRWDSGFRVKQHWP